MPEKLGGGELGGGAVLPGGLKGDRITLPGGQAAIAMATEVIPEETVVVPERVAYPEMRRAFENGTFAAGDVVTIMVTVADADGNDKTPADSNFQLTLSDYVADPTKEVLGIMYFNWIESNRMDVQTPEPPVLEG